MKQNMNSIAGIVLVVLVGSCAVRGADRSSADTLRPFISEQAVDGYFPLVSPASMADVFVAADDWQVTQIAARDLAADVERVTGRKPALKLTPEGLTENAVLVGTLGKNPVIDRLVKEGRLNVTDVQGQWESFLIATVADPVPGVRRALVIAGSDRRGTAYGIYHPD